MKTTTSVIILLAMLVVGGFFVFGKYNSETSSSIPVKLFYYNPDLDQGPGGAQCNRNGLVAVNRVLPATDYPIEDTVQLLLQGAITTEEKARGITTEYPLAGLSLASAELGNEGDITLTFNDPQNRTGGGACRVGVLWFQIEATAKQFPEVKSVRFLPEELFQP